MICTFCLTECGKNTTVAPTASIPDVSSVGTTSATKQTVLLTALNPTNASFATTISSRISPVSGTSPEKIPTQTTRSKVESTMSLISTADSTFTKTHQQTIASMDVTFTSKVFTNIAKVFTTEALISTNFERKATSKEAFQSVTSQTNDSELGSIYSNAWIPVISTLILIILIVFIAIAIYHKRKQKRGKMTITPIAKFATSRNNTTGTNSTINFVNIHAQGGNAVSSQRKFVCRTFEKDKEITVDNISNSKRKILKIPNREAEYVDLHAVGDEVKTKPYLYTKLKSSTGAKSFDNPMYMLGEQQE